MNDKKAPQQSRSKMTYDSIIEASIKVIQDSGIKNFNTNKIAEIAGVSVGSLYQFFKNKDSISDEIINRILDHQLMKMEEWINSIGDEKDLKKIIEGWVEISLNELEGQGMISRFVVENAVRIIGFERFQKVDAKNIPRFLNEIQRRGIVIRKENPELMFQFAIQAFRAALMSHFLDPKYPKDIVKNEITHLIYHYLKP
jgi:AcrR family transcriptional regulator